MTLYFRDTDIPEDEAFNTRVCVDGDLSGINTLYTLGYLSYRLQLISRYTNREVQYEGGTSWLLPLQLDLSNERYSQFTINPWAFAGGLDIANGLRSGLYDYEIWGSYLNLDWNTDPFDATEWALLQNGQTKVKSTTTVDMQRGTEPETVKYTTEPNTAKSYVIYNS
jgi:hypothetical protein